MRSPQLEDGYTRIANEILEALAKANLSGRERRILDVVLRMTYGYHRKEARIKNRIFVEMTGIARSHVCHILRDLEEKNVIKTEKNVAIDGNKSTPTYRFQKNFKKWKVLPYTAILPYTATSVAIDGNKSKKRPGSCAPTNVLPGGDFPKEKYKENIYSCEFFSVTEKQHKVFQEAYSNLDLLSEYKKMAAWLEANPSKRKTPRGYPRFINNWLSKAAEKESEGKKDWFTSLPD